MAAKNRILRIYTDEQVQERDDVQEISDTLYANVRDTRRRPVGRNHDEEFSEVEEERERGNGKR